MVPIKALVDGVSLAQRLGSSWSAELLMREAVRFLAVSLDKSERAALRQNFDAIDNNHDGAISPAEVINDNNNADRRHLVPS